MYPIKKSSPQKIGNSHYFLIPAQYINNSLIDCNKEYDIELKESKS